MEIWPSLKVLQLHFLTLPQHLTVTMCPGPGVSDVENVIETNTYLGCPIQIQTYTLGTRIGEASRHVHDS